MIFLFEALGTYPPLESEVGNGQKKIVLAPIAYTQPAEPKQ